MRAHGMVASLLHTGSAAPLYARLGWAAADLHQATLAVTLPADGAPGDHDDGVVLRAARWPDDADVLQALHAAFVAQRTGPLERTWAYWQRWVPENLTTYARAPGCASACVLATGHGGLLAYMIVRTRPRGSALEASVLELVWDEGTLPAEGGALAGLARRLWRAAWQACGLGGQTVAVRGLASTVRLLADDAASIVVEDCHRGHMVHLLTPGFPLPALAPITSSEGLAAALSAAPFMWLGIDAF
jgi:hypothetical protein